MLATVLGIWDTGNSVPENTLSEKMGKLNLFIYLFIYFFAEIQYVARSNYFLR